MPPTITDQESPTSAAEGARFEAELGAALPDEYRAFPLANNGGRSELEEFTVRWAGPAAPRPETNEVLDYFRSLGEGTVELRDGVRTLGGRLPAGMLSVAEDPFGNQLLVGLTGERRGRVYFWVHDLPPDVDETDPANLGAVADDFGSFLDRLRALEA